MNITLDQALEAEEYVDSYIRFNGGDPVAVKNTPGYEKAMPDDVKKAIETFRAFWRSQEEEGRTL